MPDIRLVYFGRSPHRIIFFSARTGRKPYLSKSHYTSSDNELATQRNTLNLFLSWEKLRHLPRIETVLHSSGELCYGFWNFSKMFVNELILECGFIVPKKAKTELLTLNLRKKCFPVPEDVLEWTLNSNPACKHNSLAKFCQHCKMKLWSINIIDRCNRVTIWSL